jgi:hypothetical protein
MMVILVTERCRLMQENRQGAFDSGEAGDGLYFFPAKEVTYAR